MNAILEAMLGVLLESAIMVPGHFILRALGAKPSDLLAVLAGLLVWTLLGLMIWVILQVV